MPLNNLKMQAKGVFQRYTRHHVAVFILTFCSYAFFHATRKTFSNVKTTIGAVWTPSPRNGSTSECMSRIWSRNGSIECLTPYDQWDKTKFFSSHDDAEKFMGTLDACFMFAYAVGLFVSGFIADRSDLRLVLSIGMSLTAVTVLVFGCVFEWLQFYSQPAYIAVWLLNGFLQSTGWPSVVAVMGNWFGKGNRGFVFGLWSSCASVGNIIGALLVAAVLDYGYQYAFLVTACVLFGGALLNFFGLVPSPIDVGLPLPKEDENKVEEHNCPTAQRPLLDDTDEVADEEYGHESVQSTASINEPVLYSIQDTRPKAINFFTACLLPGVLPYALCYAFLKLVNYSFFFWLPFYLANNYNMPETAADSISIWYDIGGIVGGTIAGVISDKLQKRAVVCVPMLIASLPVLFVYGFTQIGDSLTDNAALLFVLGSLIGGVANLISAAISADLGRQKALKGNAEALSTVTGIIDGTGSMGAAVGQVAVPQMQVRLGWRVVFYLFMASTFLTAVCIFRIFLYELNDVWHRRRGICRCCSSGDINLPESKTRDLRADHDE